MRGVLFLVLSAVLTVVDAAPDSAAINVAVDTTLNRHPFSPLIFGVAFGDAARNQQMGYPIDRWGGNSTSRYNWRGPAHNAGSDYFYLGYGTDQTDDADTFIADARNGGAQALLALPTIGWVEKFDGSHPTAVDWGFSQAKYGAQSLDECRYYKPQPDWCHADAGNGECNPGSNSTPYCVRYYHDAKNPANDKYHIAGNDPADTSIANAPADDAAWIAHLQSTFGAAANGGVKFYSLDNEVMLWNSTHRDVHPVPLSYADAWSETLQYATAIKAQEPDALVTGPVTWGYSDLWTSAADAATCNCLDGGDRTAHGHVPFVAWYLQQVCANPLVGGKRLVDYLDLHYYPQGQNVALNNDDSATTAALRLRSLKELYDPAWTSESWIGTLDGPSGDDATWHYTKPDLIPRARAWIDQYCPGTRLAITEYNWGNDGTSSGAVAQAEALAIFAREGVDLATRWVAPAAASKAERAFAIFLNYDGAGANVQGDSVGASSSNVDAIGAYAFYLAGKNTALLLTNKDTVAHDVAMGFNRAQSGTWKLYGFDAAHPLHLITSGTAVGKALTVSGLTPMSANLLLLPDDTIFGTGFE